MAPDGTIAYPAAGEGQTAGGIWTETCRWDIWKGFIGGREGNRGREEIEAELEKRWGDRDGKERKETGWTFPLKGPGYTCHVQRGDSVPGSQGVRPGLPGYDTGNLHISIIRR